MILRRFLQFGGLRLVWQYAKMGVLWSGGKALLHCACHEHSLKTAYALVTQKVDDILLDSSLYRHLKLVTLFVFKDCWIQM